MTVARFATLPFQLTTEHQVISGGSVTTTEERRHGVIRLDGDVLVVQWRVEREVNRIGPEIRTDTEHDGLREVHVPLRLVGDARVRTRGRWFWRKWELVVTARDLVAFDGLAGAQGFTFAHPAELVLPVRSTDLDAARDFASEVELAVAELALTAAERAVAPADAAPALPGRPDEAPRPAVAPASLPSAPEG